MTRRLEIDADWMTATGLAVLLIICAGMLVAETLSLVRGTFELPAQVNWQSYIAPAAGLYGAFVACEREIKAAFALFFITSAARLIVNWSGASGDAVPLAATGISLANIAMLLFVTVFVARWFKQRMKLV